MSTSHEGSRSAEFASTFRPIILGDGLIGSELAEHFGAARVLSRRVNGFDITDPFIVHEAIAATPGNVVINTIAYTNVDGAQQEPELARLANVEGPRVVARVCRNQGKRMIHLSTDFVFPGTSGPYDETSFVDPASPCLGVYARSKALGEQVVIEELGGNVAIVRIAFPTTEGGGFLKKMLGALGKHPFYYNQQLTLTSGYELRRALLRIAELELTGTFHVSSRDTVTPFEYMKYVAGEMRYYGEVLSSILSNSVDTSVKSPRPIHGGLSTIHTQRILDQRFESWRAQVDRYLPNFTSTTS